MSGVKCQVLGVRFRVAGVRCHVLQFMYLYVYFFVDKEMELVGRGSFFIKAYPVYFV